MHDESFTNQMMTKSHAKLHDDRKSMLQVVREQLRENGSQDSAASGDTGGAWMHKLSNGSKHSSEG